MKPDIALGRETKTVLMRPLDVLVLVALLGVGVWSTWRLFGAPSGSRAIVWRDGRRVAWYPLGGKLARDSIQGALGYVVVEHGEGTIRVVQSPCPGKLCLHQGKAHRQGDKLVCVPSGVVVVVESDAASDGGYDAIH